jgi:diaminohydroxyphosphoribosylaminopyrimidine deaminase / 5-amino-6-(5-phosphoribosylamino)uracil reductase
VTLEPCAHEHLTPSCAKTLVSAQVKKVTFGLIDPNPLVNGRGADILRAANIETVHDESWQTECKRLADAFLWNVREGSPFVGLKAATGLDGTMARQGARRTWITSPRARSYGHFLRIVYDAIMIGRKTLVQDNPMLDTRNSQVPGRSPRRIVLDPLGAGLTAISTSSLNLLDEDPESVIWVTAPRADKAHTLKDSLAELEASGIRRLTVSYNERDGFDLEELLGALWQMNIRSILLEGGASLYGGFLSRGLVQKLHLFQAPKVFGGGDRILWTERWLNENERTLHDVTLTPLANDLLIEGYFFGDMT